MYPFKFENSHWNENWNFTVNWHYVFSRLNQNTTKTFFCILFVLWGFWVDLCWPVLGCFQRLGDYVFVMSCWCWCWSWLLLLNHGMWWYALCWVCLYCWLLFSMPCGIARFLLWDIWLNHFWVLGQLYLGCFPITLIGLKCLLCSWWCHVMTCLT